MLLFCHLFIFRSHFFYFCCFLCLDLMKSVLKLKITIFVVLFQPAGVSSVQAVPWVVNAGDRLRYVGGLINRLKCHQQRFWSTYVDTYPCDKKSNKINFNIKYIATNVIENLEKLKNDNEMFHIFKKNLYFCKRREAFHNTDPDSAR